MTHAPNPHVDHFHPGPPPHHDTHPDPQHHVLFAAPPAPLARGRQARDPHAKTLTYSNLTSLDDLEASLRDYLAAPRDEPEHTECQLSFWIGTHFFVPAAALEPPAPTQQKPSPPQQQPQQQQQQQQQHHHHHQQQHQQKPHKPESQQREHTSSAAAPSSSSQAPPHYLHHPDAPPGYQSAEGIQQYGAGQGAYQAMTGPAVLALGLAGFQSSAPAPAPSADASATPPTSTPKKSDVPRVRMDVIEALKPTADPKEKMRKQRAIAKCCVDAIQRTDGFRYSFHNCWNSREDNSFRFSYYCNDSLLNKDRAANGKGAKLGKRATKPVYDCKGVLSVKFSNTKQSLDVFYKHNPVHKTYEERAPAPRRDSKRRKYLEENEPEVLAKIQNRPKPPRAESEGAPKPKKKKPEEQKAPATSIESDLRAQSVRMLLELIRTDAAPEPALPEPAPPPPSLPPPPAQQQPSVQVPPPNSVQQPQPTQQPPGPRKRPRNSCDICKAKKTKCDGTRPVCNTCSERKRQCTYAEAGMLDERPPPSMPDPIEPARQAQPINNELSELERMKRELEEARARIQELEEEKARSSLTPTQTPQNQRQAPPPPQPNPQPQTQTEAKPPSSKRQQPQPQQQQLHLQNTAPQSQQPQPQQTIQQLQSAAAAQQLSTPQQLQTTPFNHFTTAHSTNPYGLQRPMSAQNMSQTMTSQAVGSVAQSSPNQQLHTTSTGLTPTAENPNSYGREFAWPAYYGYQSAQQHQPDQWGARGSGVFR